MELLKYSPWLESVLRESVAGVCGTRCISWCWCHMEDFSIGQWREGQQNCSHHEGEHAQLLSDKKFIFPLL